MIALLVHTVLESSVIMQLNAILPYVDKSTAEQEAKRDDYCEFS